MGVLCPVGPAYDYEIYPINDSLAASQGNNERLGVRLVQKNTDAFRFELIVMSSNSKKYLLEFLNSGWRVSSCAVSPALTSEMFDDRRSQVERKSTILKTFAHAKLAQACIFCVNHNDPAPGKVNWLEGKKHVIGEVYLNFLRYRITKPEPGGRATYLTEIIDNTAKGDKLSLSAYGVETESLAAAKAELTSHYKKFRRHFYQNKNLHPAPPRLEKRATLEKPTLTAALTFEEVHWVRVDNGSETRYYLTGGEDNKIYYCIFNSSAGYKAFRIICWEQAPISCYTMGRVAPKVRLIGEKQSLEKLQEDCVIDYNFEYKLTAGLRMKLRQQLKHLRLNCTGLVRNLEW